MKIPLFSKLTAKSRGRKVVRASARAMRGGEEDYYEAEPNMKLSNAFMVVLVLHVVAVGGIYAFNQIKVNKSPNLLENISGKISQAAGGAMPAVAAASKTVAATAGAGSAASFAPPAPELRRMPGDADEPLPLVSGSSPAVVDTTPVVKTQPAAPAAPLPSITQTAPAKAAAAKPAAAAMTKAETAGAAPATYKVAKGDNPYKIAKKLGVSSQDLLKANGIDDPTKLQIGQVLKVPRKAN